MALSRVVSDRTPGLSKMGTTENRIGLTALVKTNPGTHLNITARVLTDADQSAQAGWSAFYYLGAIVKSSMAE